MDREKRAYYDLAEIKAIPLQEICGELGIPIKRRGNSDWFSLREESEPSCKIYPANEYCDFGDGNRGGDGIDLVAAAKDLTKADAIAWIGETFGLRSLNRAWQEGWELTDKQYALIGIQADMATKNFTFDFDTYSEEQSRAFAEKYRMPVQQLAKEYPKVYHNMLRKVSLPYLQEMRNAYYEKLFWSARFAAAEPALAQYIYADTTLESLRKAVEQCEGILRRAIKDSSLLRFHWRTYDIQRDLEKMRSGELSFQAPIRTLSYAHLKEAAAKAGEKLKYCEIPFEDFWNNDLYEKFLAGTDTVVFYKGNNVNLAYRPSAQPQIDKLKEFCFRKEQTPELKK